MLQSINPANGEIIREFKQFSSDKVVQVIQSADHSFREWRKTSFSLRSQLMQNAAKVLRKDKERYARLITGEMGKIISESQAEVEKCAWVCDYYAENAEKFLKDEEIKTDASHSYVAFQPLGVILAVMPWNFPFWQVFRFAAPALMAGNTAVLKHASNVQGCALAIEEIFREADFPEDAFRTLVIASSKVNEVIRNPLIKAVTLTGSEVAGSAVAEEAGRKIKKTVLELGGSDPFIVLEDADLPQCALTAVNSRMINQGQSCIAAKRFIVVRSMVDSFIEQQLKIMSSLKVGDPLDEQTQVGPLAREDLRDELHRQVTESVRMGARLILGGKPMERPGAFYEPTILSEVQSGMPVYDEETFGPVSVIIPVEDEDEAVKVANDSLFGLGASIWSEDIPKAERIAREIEAGAVFINGLVKSDPRLPFGGIKKSGYGRELSHYGIKEFVNIKTIWIK